MEKNEQQNYFKTMMMLNEATKYVLLKFRQVYQRNNNEKWVDGKKHGMKLFNIIQYNKFIDQKQLSNIKKGVSSDWDISLLVKLILYLEGSNKNQEIENIRKLRNNIYHSSSLIISDSEYKANILTLTNCLKSLGCSDDDLNDLLLKVETNFNNKDKQPAETKNYNEFNNLKTNGNNCFRDKDYLNAIDYYNKALNVENIFEKDKSIVHCNKANSYIELYSNTQNDMYLDNALRDAKLSNYLNPEYIKPYHRLGKIYDLKNKPKKSILYYNKLLAIDPSNSEAKNLIAVIKDKNWNESRGESIDPDFYPKSKEESVEEFIQALETRLGIEVKSDDIDKFHEFLFKEDPTLKDVFKGHEFRDGSNNCKVDFEQAAKYYSKAAQKGNAEAAYNLGLLYFKGKGVKKDYSAGLNLIEKAANSAPFKEGKGMNTPIIGVAEAQHSLGIFYENGIYYDRNPQFAIYWYEKAIQNGNSGSMNNLGSMYLNGKYIEQDLEKAEKLYLQSYSLGNKQVGSNLVDLYIKLGFPEQALLWHERDLEKGSIFSIRRDKEIKSIINEMINEFEKTGIPDWEKENGFKIDNLNFKKRRERYIDKKVGKKGNLNQFFSMMEEIYSKPKNSLPASRINLKDTSKHLKVIGKMADSGSMTARYYIQALDSGIKSYEFFNSNDIDGKIKFITTYAYGIKVYHSGVTMIGDKIKEMKNYLGEFISQNITISSELDENARLCYYHLQMNDLDQNREFLKKCTEKYPKSKYFYYFYGSVLSYLKEYQKGLACFEHGLSIDPDDYELLYVKAVNQKFLMKSDEAKETYQQFLSKAPVCNRKVPEAFYSIAYCILTEISSLENKQQKDEGFDKTREEIIRLYELGKQSEENQLPIYNDHDWPTKSRVEMYVKMLQNKDFKESSPISNGNNTIKISLSHLKIQLITEHRNDIKSFKEKFGNSKTVITNTVKPHNQNSYKNTSNQNLKQIFLRDIDTSKDYIIEGFELYATIIDVPNTGFQAVMFIIEDDNKDVVRMAVYGLGNDQELIKTNYRIGCKFKIVNPYMRQAADTKPMIRVDDPNTIFIIQYKEKVCRLCGKEDCKLRCSNCKIAYYCTKECQQEDWKVLKHNFICDS